MGNAVLSGTKQVPISLLHVKKNLCRDVQTDPMWFLSFTDICLGRRFIHGRTESYALTVQCLYASVVMRMQRIISVLTHERVDHGPDDLGIISSCGNFPSAFNVTV